MPFEYAPIHLAKGEQHSEAYRTLNRQALVPTLSDGETVVTQSLAIIEYLDECHPDPPLLPSSPAERARVRAIALSIACDIHPLNNLRVLRYLTRTLGVGDEAKDAWYRHWIETGLAALEEQLAADAMTGSCCHGGAPTMADICLTHEHSARALSDADANRRALPRARRVHPRGTRAPAGRRLTAGRAQ